MSDQYARKTRLQELAATPGRLAELVDDLSYFERFWRPGPGKWSCAEVIGHLADAEMVFGYRIRTALAETGKKLDAFEQDKWVAAERWNDIPVETALDVFVALRRATIALLELLSEEEWKRDYVHSVRGPQTIADTAALLQTHDARHLVQLGRTAEEARTASRHATGSVPR